MKPSDIANISQYKKTLKTETMKVPAILFDSNETLPTEKMLEQLEKNASEMDIFQHIAVLSDAHMKPGIINPTGSVVASEKKIIPEAFDAAPNCGMRVILTDLDEMEITGEKIKNLFKKLQVAIPSKKLKGDKISPEMVMDIFRNGSRALKNILQLRTKNEIENTYKAGNFFEAGNIPSENELRASLPGIIFWLGKFRLGLLGATNSHFLCLMRVAEIEDCQLAQTLNIKAGQYVFFLHTGSSIVGRYAASLYTARKIKSLSQRLILFLIKVFSTIDKNRLEIALRAVSNYGFANRTIITHRLDQVLEDIFERSVGTELLYDAPHVYFERENHFEKDVIIHRNGANRAYGPQRMISHPIFGKTGEPVLIAPFDDRFAYIGVGTDQNSETFFSANHEIGKLKEIRDAREPEKYAASIMSGLEANNIIHPVAKLELLKKLTY